MGGNVDRAGWKEDHGTEKGEYRRDMMRSLDFVLPVVGYDPPTTRRPRNLDDIVFLPFFSSSHSTFC
jgi:hypothetical protein